MCEASYGCSAEVAIDIYGDEAHMLICSLELHHGGLHYDAVDEVSWISGKP